ncbi:hypothetical protein QAD02_015051 [Eretmocerus hayati]|uniref:Uncharacterized protein n=1 Tax=Eretmocerus hayati TaxID=131215 RepID=A0ACC2P9K4_9HYME|nr:hypothetical protein QAD02_015051 [Eretmocerus hayati]
MYSFVSGKNDLVSAKSRSDGNKLFTVKTHNASVHYEILQLYNDSIACAPAGSETLAAAYANKAAILLHIRKFRECITQVDKAFKITTSSSLKVKLLCRRVQCLTALGSPDDTKYLEKVRFWLNKVDGGMKKEALIKLMSKSELVVQNKRDQNSMKMEKKNAKSMKTIAEAEERKDFVEIAYSGKHGSHLIASKDIRPGEILLVEKSLSIINPAQKFAYCGHCSSFLWDLVPCDFCSSVCFCSEQCKTEAWQYYHDVECSIMPHSSLLHVPTRGPYSQLGLRILIMALKQSGNITNLKNSIK